MARRKKKTGAGAVISVDRKYEGLGQAFTLEFFLRGLATNVQEELREIGHCVELIAFPDLKYGWVKIPGDTNLGLSFERINNRISPIKKMFGWQGNTLFIYDMIEKTYKQISFDSNIVFADAINDIVSYAILSVGKIVRIVNDQIDREYNYSGTVGEVYRGRLFIASGRTLYFSSPQIADPSFTSDPFTSENGGGWIVLTYPHVSKIVDLRVLNDMLYIFTDNGLYFLSSAMTSNLPSSFYLSETGLRWSFENCKILTIYKRCMVVSPMGLYELVGMNLEKKSLLVDDLFPQLNTQRAGLHYYKEQNFLVIPYVGIEKSLCYSFEYDLFFHLPFKVIDGIFSVNQKSFGLTDGQLREYYSDLSFYHDFVAKTVYHNLGVDKFKYLREIQIRASKRCRVYVFYDGYALEQGSVSMSQFYGDLWFYRNPFNRKGNKIAFYFTENTTDQDFYLSLIRAKGHVLGDLNYFYLPL